jgi:hypothetical protein
MEIIYVPREQALQAVGARVKDVEVVLDLGSGIRPQEFVRHPLVHICVDAHRPYLERVQRDVGNDPRYVFLNAPWHAVLPMLPDKSVDSVFALDFIEHLEKADGLRMLAEAQRVARVQVLVYTPNGFFPQNHEPGTPDRWGLDGGAWQTHRSGWSVEDFDDQWQFVISPDFILLDEHNQPLEEPMGALWALRDLAEQAERRYLLMEDRSVWSHTKRILERFLPTALHRLIRGFWLRACALARRRSD